MALVTGGREGIGKAVAKVLAVEGTKMAICARRWAVLEEAAKEIRRTIGGEVRAIHADVTRPDLIHRFFGEFIDTYGRIDILVNNAGTSAAGYFEGVADEGCQSDLDQELFAAIREQRMAIPHMKVQGRGRIINVTAVGGKTAGGQSVPTSVSRHSADQGFLQGLR